MNEKIIKIVASALIMALLLSNIAILSAKTINHSETKSLKLSIEHKKSAPPIKVSENPYKLEIKNPSPEEVRRKIAEKYEKEYGLKIRQPVFPNPANWTFAVYLDGDNNLNAYAEYDFNEMGSVGSDESIGLRIVVLIDKYERRVPDEVGLWYIEQGDTWNDDYSWADEYWGEQNMGDPNILIKFLEDILYNYSAYHYVIVLWDHGGAISGVCWDDTNGDHLELSEVRQAFEYIYEQYGVVFDIVCADACLMGNYFWEMTLFPYAKIAVHSQETEGAYGYPYDYILQNITNKLKAGQIPTPEYFADCVAYETIRSYNELGTTDQTQSAVNLTKAFYELGPVLGEFATTLLRKYDVFASEIDTARANADTYAADYGYDYLRDLYDFAQNIYNLISDPEIQSLAQQVMSKIWECVIANYVQPDHVDSHGISVYFPSSTNGWDSRYDSSYVGFRNVWRDLARKYEGSPLAVNFYDIWISNAIDDDNNGYYEYIQLSWDVDEDSGSGISIFLKFYALALSSRELRNIDEYENTTTEIEIGTSDTYTVTGRQDDTYSLDLYNFVPSQDTYALRANIYDSSNALRYVLHYYAQNVSVDLWGIPVEPDTLAPRLSITEPNDGDIFNSYTFNVSLTIDEAYLDQAILYVNDTIINTYTEEGSYSESVTVNQDGVYNITLWGIDNAGNEDKVIIFITVDTTPPTVTITSPSDGATLSSSTVTVAWSGSDTMSGIDHYELYLDGDPINTSIPATQTNYTLTGLSDGFHTIEIRAVDVAGNIGSDTVSFTISAQQGVSIESPTEDPSTGEAYVGCDDIVVSWNEDPNAVQYEIYVNGSPYGTTTGTNYVIQNLAEGVWNITITGVDSVGNIVSSDSATVVVDLSPPTVSSSRSLMTSDLATSQITISWSGSDSFSGIDHYEVYVAGSWVNVGNSTSYTIDTSPLSEGIYAIYIRAFDKAGHYAQTTIILIVDRTAPSITVIYPTNGSIIGASDVVIAWNATDNLLGVDHFEISVGGDTWINIGRETSYLVSALLEGTHNVSLRAYDVVGNYVEVIITFTVDLTAPTVSITEPVDGSTVTSSTVNVSWSGSDDTGIVYYLVRLDDGLWINVGTSTSYTFTGVVNGIHIVYVFAVDYTCHKTMRYVVFVVSASVGGASSSGSGTDRLASALIESVTSTRESKQEVSGSVFYLDEITTSADDFMSAKVDIYVSVAGADNTVLVVSDGQDPNCGAAIVVGGCDHWDLLVVDVVVIHKSDREDVYTFSSFFGSSLIVRRMFLVYSPYILIPPR